MGYKIVQADLAKVSADAIVLPANKYLREGAGASAAIFEAAGRRSLTKACDKIGFCPVGGAVPTDAFKLDAQYIFHVVVPAWIDGEHDEYSLLSAAYLSALELAKQMECESIAFPLLAAGNNGFDSKLAFAIANECFEKYAEHELTIYLVIYGDRISQELRDQGYTVGANPTFANKLIGKKEKKQANKQKKDVLLQKGIDFLKVDENREKILNEAVKVAQAAGAIAKAVAPLM